MISKLTKYTHYFFRCHPRNVWLIDRQMRSTIIVTCGWQPQQLIMTKQITLHPELVFILFSMLCFRGHVDQWRERYNFCSALWHKAANAKKTGLHCFKVNCPLQMPIVRIKCWTANPYFILEYFSNCIIQWKTFNLVQFLLTLGTMHLETL